MEMLKFTRIKGSIYIKKSEIIAIDVHAHRGGIVPLARIYISGAFFDVDEPVDEVLKMIEQ